MSKSKKSSKQQHESPESDEEFAIKPEKGVPMIDTSSWPLLLKVTPFFFS
jgi:hypothetical protein